VILYAFNLNEPSVVVIVALELGCEGLSCRDARLGKVKNEIFAPGFWAAEEHRCHGTRSVVKHIE
jgi:hypothetical protein